MVAADTQVVGEGDWRARADPKRRCGVERPLGQRGRPCRLALRLCQRAEGPPDGLLTVALIGLVDVPLHLDLLLLGLLLLLLLLLLALLLRLDVVDPHLARADRLQDQLRARHVLFAADEHAELVARLSELGYVRYRQGRLRRHVIVHGLEEDAQGGDDAVRLLALRRHHLRVKQAGLRPGPPHHCPFRLEEVTQLRSVEHHLRVRLVEPLLSSFGEQAPKLVELAQADGLAQLLLALGSGAELDVPGEVLPRRVLGEEEMGRHGEVRALASQPFLSVLQLGVGLSFPPKKGALRRLELLKRLREDLSLLGVGGAHVGPSR
mmetsp:Transcript_14115/g.32198  ORF Transcript_14115/g.32198 Transcript_14115/m.32198 type:complete len:321 (+) Transcript_14115:1284-2246(+)